VGERNSVFKYSRETTSIHVGLIEFKKYAYRIEIPKESKYSRKRTVDEVIEVSVSIPQMSKEKNEELFKNGFHVFATLPAEAARFRIVINADWDVNSARTQIDDNKRNNFLAENFLLPLLEDVFIKDEMCKENWIFLLPNSNRPVLDGSFNAKIIKKWTSSRSYNLMIKELSEDKLLIASTKESKRFASSSTVGSTARRYSFRSRFSAP
jgi:hypothetical protein